MIKVAIISTLKPTTEVRIYKRFAKSLSKTNKYEINIIGLAQKNAVESDKNIKHYFLKNIKRGICNRVKSWKMIKAYLLDIQPGIVIITSPDQLIPILNNTRNTHYKVIYDVQENYWNNLIYQRIYPFPINVFLAITVRFLEAFTKRRINHFIVAEKVYANQLPFIKSKFTVIENRIAFDVNIKSKLPKEITILFTGIISTYAGIEATLKLYKKIKTKIPSVKLIIAGFAPLTKHRNWLKIEAGNDPYITLIGIDEHVNHDTILTEICNASLGVISYGNTRALKGRIPSKLYEYSYCRLPYLIDFQSPIMNDALSIGGALPIDFNDPNLDTLANQLLEIQEKQPIYPEHPSSWKFEEEKFINLINHLT